MQMPYTIANGAQADGGGGVATMTTMATNGAQVRGNTNYLQWEQDEARRKDCVLLLELEKKCIKWYSDI